MFQGSRGNHHLVRRLLAWLVVLSLSAGLAACESVQGGPARPVDTSAELKRLKKYFTPEMIAEYENVAGAAKRQKRNEIVNGRLAFYDLSYNTFKRALYREGVLTNIGVDVTTIGLGAAGALADGGVSRILSAVSGGIVGAKESVDKNAFFERTMPALVMEMDAARRQVLTLIRPQLDTDVGNYPLEAALIDLEAYYIAGTIPGAIAGIIEASGEKAARANTILMATRTAEFFAADRQSRVEKLVDAINGLEDDKALELARNSPTTTAAIERAVAAADRRSQRFTNADVARRILKMYATLIGRDDATLDQWEDAVAK